MEDPFGGLRRNPRYLIARCYLFNILLFIIQHSVFGIVIRGLFACLNSGGIWMV